MTRRLARFAPLLLILILLAGCTTYSGNHYRDGYYSDGGYYYPAEDGYGDYYAAPDYGYDYDYYDYGYSTYTPFWGLHRYGCGAWGGCSPYWSYYYGRPYSGWSLSYGQHWSYGSWGWYGQYWAPLVRARVLRPWLLRLRLSRPRRLRPWTAAAPPWPSAGAGPGAAAGQTRCPQAAPALPGTDHAEPGAVEPDRQPVPASGHSPCPDRFARPGRADADTGAAPADVRRPTGWQAGDATLWTATGAGP
ncbi:hypothetical protein [Arenimonas daejeonensis]|uniref:hypothetical protein n=1 Tax=Arenimonas daejeonensis TaxID=370777 RepID=UPI0011BE8D42|nr:hypothetical protein [Arenimonas daejeonensis]